MSMTSSRLTFKVEVSAEWITVGDILIGLTDIRREECIELWDTSNSLIVCLVDGVIGSCWPSSLADIELQR